MEAAWRSDACAPASKAAASAKPGETPRLCSRAIHERRPGPHPPLIRCLCATALTPPYAGASFARRLAPPARKRQETSSMLRFSISSPFVLAALSLSSLALAQQPPRGGEPSAPTGSGSASGPASPGTLPTGTAPRAPAPSGQAGRPTGQNGVQTAPGGSAPTGAAGGWGAAPGSNGRGTAGAGGTSSGAAGAGGPSGTAGATGGATAPTPPATNVTPIDRGSLLQAPTAPTAPPAVVEPRPTDRPLDASIGGNPKDVYAEDWWSHVRPILELHGYFRLRAELFHGFALGRADPPGAALWPQPLDNNFTDVLGVPHAVGSYCKNPGSPTATTRARRERTFVSV